MSRQQLTRYMPTVVGYRERLATLQGAWDSLALLSHLNGDGTNLGSTRQAFEALAVDLVTHLTAETQKKALHAAKARAQVAIDILVRNLFERTAEVGLLAADDVVRSFARDVPSLRKQLATEDDSAARSLAVITRTLQGRLSEYVTKYSVYQNVIVLSPTGDVLAQLEGGNAPAHSSDTLISDTLTSSRAFVETSRQSDLVPDSRRALIYSHAITADKRNVGVLCLVFRLADECAGIFNQLRSEGDWTVLCLLGADGEVIASSDPYQVPLGAKVPAADSNDGAVIRFAGREYLAVTRSAQPYQGYAGPPWRGHVMVPIERVFEAPDTAARLSSHPEILADLRASSAMFSAELRAIPGQADNVQVDLNRSVWNGSVRLSSQEGNDGTFAKALLREISQMGRKTQEVFERSISELHETVVSSLLDESQFMGSLAVELLARNLYERANDCRWWALDATLIGYLTKRESTKLEEAAEVLRHINDIYTVYYSIVLFDADRRVIAVSRAEHKALVGTVIDEPWADETLSITGPQAYSVSDFKPSAFYNEQPTLVYGAPVRSTQGRVVGGVAVVFDSKTQLDAMLQHSLPRDERGEPMTGCAALFLDHDLHVIAATETSAEAKKLVAEAIKDKQGQNEAHVICVGDMYYALGTGSDRGYREYPGLGGYAAVLIPLGKASKQRIKPRPTLPQRVAMRSDESKQSVIEFATFAVGREWYAVRASNVIEAIDAKGIQQLPAKASWCAGLIMFHGTPIVVADMARVLETACLETPRIVVVVHTPERRDPFGLLVETLGDISEVSSSRLLSIADPRNEHSHLVEQAVQPLDPKDVLVLTLSIERLSAMMGGAASSTTPDGDPGARNVA